MFYETSGTFKRLRRRVVVHTYPRGQEGLKVRLGTNLLYSSLRSTRPRVLLDPRPVPSSLTSSVFGDLPVRTDFYPSHLDPSGHTKSDQDPVPDFDHWNLLVPTPSGLLPRPWSVRQILL